MKLQLSTVIQQHDRKCSKLLGNRSGGKARRHVVFDVKRNIGVTAAGLKESFAVLHNPDHAGKIPVIDFCGDIVA